MAPPKDLTCWCWKRDRLAAKPVQVQESKITWGFHPVSRARSSQPWAYIQAQKFGADMLITKGTRLIFDHKPYIIEADNGARIPARTIVIATGAEYRRPPWKNLSRFEGVGVYYGATFVEAQYCGGEELIVVGGGNSAGQAAVFLAETAKRVYMLIRSAGLVESMSRYLINRIEETSNIVLRSHTQRS